jgi:hypothetical protein
MHPRVGGFFFAAATTALMACGGASTPSSANDSTPVLVPFTPPSPLGCDGASAYDACLAFDNQTPFAVHVLLPREVPKGTVLAIRFHPPQGESANVPEFSDAKVHLPAARSSLALYFQVFPARYLVEIAVDADGDGDPNGVADLHGWSSSSSSQLALTADEATALDVGNEPVATTFSAGAP